MRVTRLFGRMFDFFVFFYIVIGGFRKFTTVGEFLVPDGLGQNDESGSENLHFWRPFYSLSRIIFTFVLFPRLMYHLKASPTRTAQGNGLV